MQLKLITLTLLLSTITSHLPFNSHNNHFYQPLNFSPRGTNHYNILNRPWRYNGSFMNRNRYRLGDGINNLFYGGTAVGGLNYRAGDMTNWFLNKRGGLFGGLGTYW